MHLIPPGKYTPSKLDMYFTMATDKSASFLRRLENEFVISDCAIEKLPSLLVKQKSDITMLTVESFSPSIAIDRILSIFV